MNSANLFVLVLYENHFHLMEPQGFAGDTLRTPTLLQPGWFPNPHLELGKPGAPHPASPKGNTTFQRTLRESYNSEACLMPCT